MSRYIVFRFNQIHRSKRLSGRREVWRPGGQGKWRAAQLALDRPKFKFEKDKISAILNHIEHRGFTIAASPLSQSLPDIDDQAFLEVAIAAQVECLVTGNQVHFPLELCQGVTVLSPGEFLSFYKKRLALSPHACQQDKQSSVRHPSKRKSG